MSIVYSIDHLDFLKHALWPQQEYSSNYKFNIMRNLQTIVTAQQNLNLTQLQPELG